MKLINLLILSLLMLTSFVAIGQSGPGGIGDTSGDSNLQLWLKATDLQGSHSDGEQVLSWTDRSGATNHVLGTSTSAPIFKNRIGGNPAFVEFSGRQFLQTKEASSSFSNPAATIFLVKKGAHKGAAIALAENGWVNEMLLLGDDQYHHSSSGNFVKQAHPCIRQIPSEELSIIAGVFGQAPKDLRYFVNGVEAPNTLQQTRSNVRDFEQVERKITIGQRDQFVSSEYYEGDLLEVIVYNRKLTDEEIQQVEQYLQCTYQIEPSVCTELGEVSCVTEENCPSLKNSVDTDPLQLWLKASDLEQIFVDGARVTIWPDRSGEFNHLLGAYQTAPAFKKGTIDNPATVEFSGQQFLQTSSVSSSFNNPESTIFLVKKGISKGAPIAIAEQGWVNEMLLFDGAQFHHSSSGNFTKLDHPCIEKIQEAELSIICGVFGPEVNNLRYFVNGEEAPNNTIRTAGQPREFGQVDRKVTVGQRDQFVASEYFEGDLLEILVFNKQLNDEEIAHVNNYLNCTYQLESSVCYSLNEDVKPNPSDSCNQYTGTVIVDQCRRVFIQAMDADSNNVLINPLYQHAIDVPPLGTKLQFNLDVHEGDLISFYKCQGKKPIAISGSLTCIKIIEEEVPSLENDSLANNCDCPQVVEPVCGTDDKVYNNACEAACAGVGVVYSGPTCDLNDLCVIIIKNGYCSTLGVYDENDNLITEMAPGPDGFDGFTFWEDLNFLLRGTNRTYVFKINGVEISRKTVSCDEYIIELVSNQADPCAEIMDSIATPNPALFEEYAWLSDLVNPQSCSKASVVVYQNGIYKYLLVTDDNGAAILYNEQGQFYCQNSASYDCVAAYQLGNPIDTWTCNGVTVPPIVDCEDCEEEEEEEETIDDSENVATLFNDYAWLSDLINPTNCTNESIAVYQSGIYKYLLVTDDSGTSKMYNETGQLYCQQSANYDCIGAYNLSDPIASWSCSSDGDCPTIFMPVCGYDDTTYRNLCESEQAGIDAAYEGVCRTNFNCAKFTGTVIKANCDNGNPFYFVRTDAGQVYDLYLDTNIAYQPEEGQRINFDFVKRTDLPFCSISDAAIIIKCLEIITPTNILNDLDISEAQCQGVGQFSISISTKRPINSLGGVPPYRIYSEAGSPYAFDKRLSQFGEATLSFGDSLATEIAILIEDTMNPSNTIRLVRSIPNCQNSINEIYPFLDGEKDQYGCNAIEVFDQGNHAFIFLRLGPNKGRLYLDSGTFYCESTPTYDCLSAYGLGIPTNVYSCSNLDNGESVERAATPSSQLAFTAFPNPTTGRLTIQLPPNSTSEYQLSVHDMLGRTVYQTIVAPLTTSVELDMATQDDGVYYIEVRAAGMGEILKVVKKEVE